MTVDSGGQASGTSSFCAGFLLTGRQRVGIAARNVQERGVALKGDDFHLGRASKALTEGEIITLLVEDKWMATLERDVKTEMERISHRLTGRIKELAERYDTTVIALANEVDVLEKKVNSHLKNMGFVWK